jgi:hypothetical protein
MGVNVIASPITLAAFTKSNKIKDKKNLSLLNLIHQALFYVADKKNRIQESVVRKNNSLFGMSVKNKEK